MKQIGVSIEFRARRLLQIEGCKATTEIVGLNRTPRLYELWRNYMTRTLLLQKDALMMVSCWLDDTLQKVD